jgi:hypothetical protein
MLQPKPRASCTGFRRRTEAFRLTKVGRGTAFRVQPSPSAECRLIAKARNPGRPAPDEIRAYLAWLLGAAAFPASDRRRKLLAYVVDQTLAGRARRLHEFDLALSVLGRDERFDPQSDPIVRIEVGRLRRDLERYYLTEGRDDPIRIILPKGGYVPTFEAMDPASAPGSIDGIEN